MMRYDAVFRFKKFKNSMSKPQPQSQPQPKPKPMFTEVEVLQVMQLGYARSVAVYALEACQGDVNKACDLLLEYGLVCHRPYS